MIILSSRLLKQFKSKIKACPINAGLNIAFNAFHTLHFISYLLNSYLAANFGCYLFRIIPEIVSKTFSHCHVESEHTPSSQTGRQFMLLCTGFDSEHTVLFLCLFLLRDQDWMKRRALLCSVTSPRQFHRKFHFTWKTDPSSQPKIYIPFKPFWLLN